MEENTKKSSAKKPVSKKPRDSELGLKLYYQPIVQPMFGKTIGYEGLIRLIDKELRFVSPSVFIPIAEKSGLNAQLGTWVIEEGCRVINKMEKKGIEFEYVSVNVSPKHFAKKDFVPEMQRIIAEHKISASKLCLEISELSLASKGGPTMEKMSELQNIGFKIAIDDFGGEYAALSKLGSIPADILKLDKKFVDRIVIDPKSRDVTESIIELAIKLNLEVVAKGIEDSIQQKMLMQMGCHKMQGFLFGEPLRERDILNPKKKAADTEE